MRITTGRSATLLAACLLGTSALAQTPLWSLDGDTAGDNFGNSVGSAGDVNGDGHADVIVGAPREGLGGFLAGGAWVYSGLDGSLLHTFLGEGSFELFGGSVNGAGDVDRDGYDDVIIGAPYNDSSGSAYVFSGFDGSLLHKFGGVQGDDYFGGSVDGAGDVNRDGYADLIVGAAWDKTTQFFAGAARVYSGLDGSILHEFFGDAGSHYLGRCVRGAGDVDNDGYPDLIVGADGVGGSTGMARVYSGFDGSILYTFNGHSGGDYFGQSVDGAGDVNGDGHADLIVGAYAGDGESDKPGFANVYSGLDGVRLYTFTGDAAQDWLGIAVSGVGDVNGDGYDDVIVGSSHADANGVDSGKVTVYSGADGSVLSSIAGAAAADGFGLSACAAGDVDADGHPDFIAGAPYADAVGSSTGNATVFRFDGPFGPWANLGQGLDGIYAAPLLRGIGSLVGGEVWTLDLSGGLESSIALLTYGFDRLDLPLFGGTLVPNILAPGGVLPMATDATGSLVLSSTWPTGLPSGITLYFQVWVVDLGGPESLSASNGVAATAP